MKLAVLLLVLTLGLSLSGCHGPWPTGPLRTDPALAQARELVWDRVYGGPGVGPDVIFVNRNSLNCNRRRGFKYDNMCVYGLYFHDSDTAYVAWRPGDTFSSTAYAHELYHAFLFKTTGDADPDHSGEGWKSGGLVEKARDALEIDSL